MNAVVVLGAEVDRGEAAVLVLRRQRGVAADHGGGRKAVAFGLEDLVVLDRAELADRAIDRANQLGIGQRSRTGLEGSGKEVVEGGVTGDVGIERLAHVDLVFGNKAANNFGGDPAALAPRHITGKCGERLLGNQVLRQNGGAVRHRQAA